MPTDKNLICNMALGHCGVAPTIQDVDNDTTPEALYCRTFYETCRGSLLEMQEWNFAKRRATLNVLSGPPNDWAYRYKIPNTCKLPLNIVNPNTRNPRRDERIPFDIKDYDDGYGKVIVTDQADAQLDYNFDVTDESLFSDTFAFAFSQLLAVNISTPLRVSGDLKREIRQDFLVWLSEAGSLSLRSDQPEEEPISEYQAVRG